MAVKVQAVSPHKDYLKDLKILAKSPVDDSMTPALCRLEPYQIFEIERMASQGLNLETIAARLGYEFDVWLALIKANPEIDRAFRAGAARGVDWVSSAGLANARAGDASMIKYYLDRFGGPQFRPAQQGPAVVIHNGPVANIDQDRMTLRFERQRALIDGTIDLDAPDATEA